MLRDASQHVEFRQHACASRCDVPRHEDRREQSVVVENDSQRGLPVSGLFFTGVGPGTIIDFPAFSRTFVHVCSCSVTLICGTSAGHFPLRAAR